MRAGSREVSVTAQVHSWTHSSIQFSETVFHEIKQVTHTPTKFLNQRNSGSWGGKPPPVDGEGTGVHLHHGHPRAPIGGNPLYPGAPTEASVRPSAPGAGFVSPNHVFSSFPTVKMHVHYNWW